MGEGGLDESACRPAKEEGNTVGETGAPLKPNFLSNLHQKLQADALRRMRKKNEEAEMTPAEKAAVKLKEILAKSTVPQSQEEADAQEAMAEAAIKKAMDDAEDLARQRAVLTHFLPPPNPN